MTDDTKPPLEVHLDETAMRRLEAIAVWRETTVTELVQAYVEDWIDIDYPASQGRLTRRGLYRDGPPGLCEKTRQETSRNWEADLKAEGL